jgi:hypothetical protein
MKSVPVILSIFMLTAACPAAVAQKSAPIKKVENVMRNLEKEMCKSFDLDKCPTETKRKPVISRPAEPDSPPIPRKKPISHGWTETPQKSPVAIKVETREAVIIPLPRLKSQQVAVQLPTIVQRKQTALVTGVATAPKLPTSPAKTTADACSDSLVRAGVVFKQERTLASASQCSVENPVRLITLRTASSSVAFPDKPLLNCEFARSLANWTREVAAPLVKLKSGAALVSLSTGPGYECRGRNGDGSAKMSEHATGNAVDIEKFKIANGTTVLVKDARIANTTSHATLVALRAAACEAFTTVLGPGSNAAHAEHFHFDNGKHGKSGTYRVCE